MGNIGWVYRPGVGWIIGRIDLAGTSEGAIKGWETRRQGGGGVDKGDDGLSGLIKTISQPDGGFTYSPTTKTSPTKGYALSIYKDREKAIPVNTLKLSDLGAYVNANKDLLTQSGNYLGAWHNPKDGQVYFDVSTVVDSPEQARALADKHQQLAYFDLERGSSVDVHQ